MFKVIEKFVDLQDSDYMYEVGDEYPRLGLNPSLARIEELKGTDNKRGIALIEEVEEMPDDAETVQKEDEPLEALLDVEDEPKEESKVEKKAAKKSGRKSTSKKGAK